MSCSLLRRAIYASSLLLPLLGCGHSDPFSAPPTSLGPRGSGADVQLTFNPDQDYWPTWTQDGRGILYAFVPSPGATQRCMGLLPAAGGTRIWELCDNRTVQVDTTSSFAGYALAASGSLLYVEVAASIKTPFITHSVLWLADTAHPFQRSALLTLPVTVNGESFTWLSELAWTGPQSFIALGQQVGTVPHCPPPAKGQPPGPVCSSQDTTLGAGLVVTGTISGSQAILTGVTGTEGATDFDLIDGGATIVFVVDNDQRLFSVAASGGPPAVVATVASFADDELLGVSCSQQLPTTCVVAVDPIMPGSEFPAVAGATLLGVSLPSGTVQTLFTPGGGALSSPVVSPINGNVVVQFDGPSGHVHTTSTSISDLHLLAGLVP